MGFFALILIPQPNDFVAILPRALFVIIPLALLALVAGRHRGARQDPAPPHAHVGGLVTPSG